LETKSPADDRSGPTIPTSAIQVVVEAGGGTIGPDGTSGMRKLYHAPDSPGVFHVQIIAKIDPSVTDTSTITVNAEPTCPTDYVAADGTPCPKEGQQCTDKCTGACDVCDVLLCYYGSDWRRWSCWIPARRGRPTRGAR
jgi:hypothetical protein